MTTATRTAISVEAVRPSPQPSSKGAEANRWAALPVLMAGTFMIVLDFFIVNVALPAMQVDLRASTSAIEWVVAGYGLTFATFLITAGRIGDQIGRRRAFCIGLGLFTLTSAACGIAPDAFVLVLARVVQGLAGALLSPNVLAIIGVVYRGPERVRALTVYGMVMGVAAACAQLIGGVLVNADIAGLGWRTIFLINLPVGIVALILAPRLVPESRAAGARGIDVVGTLLVTAGLGALLLPLVEGRAHGWPTWAWLSLAAAHVLLVGFAAYELRIDRLGGAPLLEASLFRVQTFSVGLLTQLTFWCGQASFFMVLALYLQQGRGLDPLAAGLVFTILAAAYLVTSLCAAKLAVRYGRDLIAVGALTFAAGHALLFAGVAVVGTSGWIGFLTPGLVLVGGGMGLCITPLISTVLSHVHPQHAGAASGALSTVQQLGNSLGVATTGIIFFGTLNGDGGYAEAFQFSLAEFAGLLLVVAALTRLLPPRNPNANGA
jgi:EmrB/QacA subfamily drug resistance transporter